MKYILVALLAFITAPAFGQNVFQATPNPVQTKMVQTTYNLSTATGTQAITGCGFRPTAIDFFGVVDGTIYWAMGASDSARGYQGLYSYLSGSISYQSGGWRIHTDNVGSNYQTGVINSYDADGLTIGWTKAGTATGTAVINIRCMR